jgi:hypothetical protein
MIVASLRHIVSEGMPVPIAWSGALLTVPALSNKKRPEPALLIRADKVDQAFLGDLHVWRCRSSRLTR